MLHIVDSTNQRLEVKSQVKILNIVIDRSSGIYFKGQLISKANFEVFIWTKKQTKIFLYICPSL
jgi:hypothetical protein